MFWLCTGWGQDLRLLSHVCASRGGLEGWGNSVQRGFRTFHCPQLLLAELEESWFSALTWWESWNPPHSSRSPESAVAATCSGLAKEDFICACKDFSPGVFEQSGILNFHEFCSKVTPRCGERESGQVAFSQPGISLDESGQVAFSQPGISLARKMREEVIQVAKMALRTQQFKTAINDDLTAAIKDFLHEVRIWCNEAEDAIKHDPKRDIYMVCSDCCSNSFHTKRGCRKTLLLRRFHELQSFNWGTVRVARGFSEYKRPWEKLRDATSKLLDLSLASELQNSDPQRDMSATSLSSWSLIDVVDRNALEVESIASCNSVDSQTSCLSASGGPHCFLPTCRFKCVEDETSLVREVLGKDAKLLKHVPLVTQIHLWWRFYIPDSRWYHLGGGFEYFLFSPLNIYSSKGLKPPIIQIQVLCGALVLL